MSASQPFQCYIFGAEIYWIELMQFVSLRWEIVIRIRHSHTTCHVKTQELITRRMHQDCNRLTAN